MREVSFCDIKPFVRYVRYLDKDMYRHQQTMRAYDSRLLYCCDGEGKIIVDGESYHIKKGTILIWRCGVSYRYALEENNGMKFIALNFDFLYDKSNLSSPIPPARESSFDEKNMTEDLFFTDCPVFNRPCFIENAGQFYARLSELEKEFGTRGRFYETKISGLLTCILAEIAVFGNGKGEAEHKTVNAVIAYMKIHLDEDLSNETLSVMFKYHPNYINQLFVHCTGKSVHRYLSDLRISKAMELLQSTTLAICEISTLCGFSDMPHFSKAFKRVTGYPPSKFRLL